MRVWNDILYSFQCLLTVKPMPDMNWNVNNKKIRLNMSKPAKVSPSCHQRRPQKFLDSPFSQLVM